MCGIAGIYSQSEKINFIDVKKMTVAIKHRGPDATNYHNQGNYATGCARLSIVDRTIKSNIPYSFDSLVLSFNGEIYNFQELRKILIKKNYKFHTMSDTEVVIKSFHYWGVNCFKKFEGMYACAIFDKKNDDLILARDPLGIKTLYYLSYKKSFFYSSEIKSFKKIKKLKLNKSKIYEWFLLNENYGEETLVDKVKKVLPGQILNFRGKKITTTSFFSLLKTFKDKKIFKKNHIEKLLKEKTELHLCDKKVKSAFFLSGGLDSSLITAMMNRKIKLDNNKNLYSISGQIQFQALNETSYQKNVIQKSEIKKNISIKINKKNFLSESFKLMKHLEFPCFSPSLVGLNILFKNKIKKTKVVYTGDGADEIFLGYDWFQDSKPTNLKQMLNSISYINEKTAKHILRNKPKKLHCVLKKKLSSLSEINKFRYINQRIYLQKWLLSRDVIGMLNSTEVRVPYCDLSILKFVNKISSERLFDNKNKKILLKNISKKYLSKDITDRKKIGFTIPIYEWLDKQAILFYFKKLKISDSNNYRKINIKKLLKEHFSKKKNHIRAIWTIISFEMWNKFFLNDRRL